MTSNKPGLFAREATGLVREIGFTLGVIIILSPVLGFGFEGTCICFGLAMAPSALPTWLGDPMWMFIGGLAIVWIFAILALLGTKLYGRLMEIIFYIPAVITIVFFALWIAGALDPSLVVKGVQNTLGAPPSTFMTAAIDTGMTNPANIAGFFDSFSYALGR